MPNQRASFQSVNQGDPQGTPQPIRRSWDLPAWLALGNTRPFGPCAPPPGPRGRAARTRGHVTPAAMAVVPGGPRSGPAVRAQFFCTAGRGLEPFLIREVRERLAATQVSRPRSELEREAGRPRPHPCPWSLPVVPPRWGRPSTRESDANSSLSAREPSSAGRSFNCCQKDPPALSPTHLSLSRLKVFFKRERLMRVTS